MNKLRYWLISKLLHGDKATLLTKNELGTDLLQFISAQITKDTERYTSDFMAQKVAAFQPEFLARMIETNHNLTDTQKSAITSILQSTQRPDVSLYG